MLPESIDGELLERLRTAYEGKPTAPELAVLLTTSGSTGSPKLVRLSRKNISEDNKLSDDIFNLDASVRMTMVLPICYAWGLSVACAVLEAGGTLVMTRKTVMDAELADVMLDARATHFAGVPYMYEVLDRLLSFEREFPALRDSSFPAAHFRQLSGANSPCSPRSADLPSARGTARRRRPG
jgi:long-subunit acyl-CoA synthetase (AMP-forming)